MIQQQSNSFPSNFYIEANYIPSYLRVVGYSQEEGDEFEPWPTKILGNIYSHEMPIVKNKHLEKCFIRFYPKVELWAKIPATDLPVDAIKHTYYASAHAFIFEKGYMWDGLNGWRPYRLNDEAFAELKTKLLFSQ